MSFYLGAFCSALIRSALLVIVKIRSFPFQMQTIRSEQVLSLNYSVSSAIERKLALANSKKIEYYRFLNDIYISPMVE